jgi:hypothetical protein
VHPQPRDLGEPALPAVRPDSLLPEGDGSDERGVIPGVVPMPGMLPFERRQPQVERRSVLPVEWFRRMPGGSTTYAVPGAGPADGGAAVDGS